MIVPTEAQRRGWMTQWRAAAVALARIRQQEIDQADLGRIANDLEDACVESARSRASSVTSGLVEQLRLFHRLRVG